MTKCRAFHETPPKYRRATMNVIAAQQKSKAKSKQQKKRRLVETWLPSLVERAPSAIRMLLLRRKQKGAGFPTPFAKMRLPYRG